MIIVQYFASITTSLLKGQHTLVICTGKGEYNNPQMAKMCNIQCNSEYMSCNTLQCDCEPVLAWCMG